MLCPGHSPGAPRADQNDKRDERGEITKNLEFPIGIYGKSIYDIIVTKDIDDTRKRKGDNKMHTYELTPTDGRKSFYGKARVEVSDDGSATLYSYNPPVLRKDADGHYCRLWGRIGKFEWERMVVSQ